MPTKLVVVKILAPLGLKSATDISVQRRSWAMPDARGHRLLKVSFAELATKLGDHARFCDC